MLPTSEQLRKLATKWRFIVKVNNTNPWRRTIPHHLWRRSENVHHSDYRSAWWGVSQRSRVRCVGIHRHPDWEWTCFPLALQTHNISRNHSEVLLSSHQILTVVVVGKISNQSSAMEACGKNEWDGFQPVHNCKCLWLQLHAIHSKIVRKISIQIKIISIISI